VGTAKMFVEYVVLDIEPVRGAGHGQSGKWLLADVQVARVSDFGVNDHIMSARTHLGHHLQAGDTALGYDLASLQIVDPELDKYRRGLALPDVLLVKKSYQEKRRRRRARGVNRQWKLQRLDVVEDEAGGHKAVAREAERAAMDEELFMQELEEDEETRAHVRIFRDDAAGSGAGAGAGAADASDDDDDVPEVPIEALLDGLTLARGAAEHAPETHDYGEDDEAEGDHEMMD
jgi:nonsense-mediated mRNA decay protein 3